MRITLLYIAVIALGVAAIHAAEEGGTLLDWGGAPALARRTEALAELGTNCMMMDANSGWSMALRTDKRVIIWGSNGYGQTNIPPQAMTNIAFIECGWRDGYAIDATGNWHNWGLLATNLPQQWGIEHPVVTDAKKIAAGDLHYTILRSNGTLVIVSKRASITNSIPAPVTNGTVVDIASGYYHMLALMDDGKCYTWGEATPGQTNTVPPEASNGVAKVFCSQFGNYAILSNQNKLITWGLNDYGQMSGPYGELNVVDVDGGYNHTILCYTNLQAAAWGDNTYSQTDIPSPNTNVFSVGAGLYHSQALIDVLYGASQPPDPDPILPGLSVRGNWRLKGNSRLK